MKTIQLNKGMSTIVDDEDFDELSKNRWCAHKSKRNRLYYVIRNSVRDERGHQDMIHMHRVITGAKKGQIVDHVNGDSLDNRRSNLRICSSSENAMNRRVASNSTSGFKGVSFNTRSGRWKVCIMARGNRVFVGLFATAKEGAVAYDEAAKKYFGEFARLNNVKR